MHDVIIMLNIYYNIEYSMPFTLLELFKRIKVQTRIYNKSLYGNHEHILVYSWKIYLYLNDI